jgi:hypothetical protein
MLMIDRIGPTLKESNLITFGQSGFHQDEKTNDKKHYHKGGTVTHAAGEL